MNRSPINQWPTGHNPDSQSLEEILARARAHRAEQTRLASTQGPALAECGPREDEEPANLLADERSGPSVFSASPSGESDAFATQTGHGPDDEAMADLAGESAAHPSLAADAQTGFTQGLPGDEWNAARTTLSDEIKEFIVKGLACYDTPSQVAEAVNLMFGIRVSRQRVNRYKPDSPRPPAQRWRDLHAATRQALLRELAEIGVAHRAVRLRRLDRLASRSEQSNVTTALKCLEMAAKECGGMYESRRRSIVRHAALPLPPA
jgi:hypothetical protein